VFLALLGATYFVYQRVPRAFLPEDDQGYVIFVVQAPQGASLSYTRDICARADQIIERDPEVEGVFTIVGEGTAGSAPNQALMYASLKPFEERKGDIHSAATVIRRLRSSLSAISGAVVVPFNPPAVFGLGQLDRKSTRLNSSHVAISYAVFCLKKKKKKV